MSVFVSRTESDSLFRLLELSATDPISLTDSDIDSLYNIARAALNAAVSRDKAEFCCAVQEIIPSVSAIKYEYYHEMYLLSSYKLKDGTWHNISINGMSGGTDCIAGALDSDEESTLSDIFQARISSFSDRESGVLEIR